MISSHPILSRFVIFVFAPLSCLLLWMYLSFAKSLPQTQGDIAISGIEHPVSLARDGQGIVHIKAQSDKDAFFALGFAHAQDRLWQLEVQKRTVQGRLSEIFGKSTVNTDIWFRTLGLYQSGAKSWDVLSAEAQSSLTAYTAGINAWLDSAETYPAEFTLLGIEPEPWHVNDSLAYIKLFALNLSGDFRQEIRRMLAAQLLDEAQLATVFGSYPDDAPTTVAQVSPRLRQGLTGLLTLQQSLENQLKIGGRFVGSNAWVVAGQHTQNGQTLLANDPHLGLQIPSLWYAASLRGDKLDSAGMTLVGLPLVVFGRNQHISWGGTSMMLDNQDLYFERVNENDPTLYFSEGQWTAFEVRSETLTVRADFPSALRKTLAPLDIKVRSTRHGPVISDIFEVFEHPVSLRWTALTDKDTTYEAFFKLNYAANWSAFNDALSLQVAPGLNMLYADRQGNIGYLGAGHIPVRSKGSGALPMPGWDEQFQWQGVVPSGEMPQSFNPASGFIVNANNKVVDDDYPYFISRGWAPPARAARISERLSAKIQHSELMTGEDMADIQGDTVDLSAKVLLPLLRGVTGDNQRQQQAIELLSQWDGDMQRDSKAAALFSLWTPLLRKAVFSDELTREWGRFDEQGFIDAISGNVSNENLLAVLGATHSPWCDDVLTATVEDCTLMLTRSLDRALKRLDKLQGNDVDDWQWGEVNHTAYNHQPFSQFKLLDGIFERKISNGGSANTVNVSVSSYSGSEGYLQTFGAGFRQIIGLTDSETRHLLMNSTGQSGNVLSDHYDDMVVPFRDIEFVSMDAPVQHALVLTPKDARKQEPKS